jgi:hypothetical protein
MSRITQKTIAERMKPRYPSLTQPIVSAVVSGKAGVQYTARFRRDAEQEGITFKKDRDGRATPCKFNVRLTEGEAAEFYRFLEGTGQTAQQTLRDLVLKLIGVD